MHRNCVGSHIATYSIVNERLVHLRAYIICALRAIQHIDKKSIMDNSNSSQLNMTTTPTVETYLSNGVEYLSNDYYTANNERCDICMEAEQASPLDLATASARDVEASRAVIKTRACSHVFHKLCLQRWLSSQVRTGNDGSCPKCRHVLVEAHRTTDGPAIVDRDDNARIRREIASDMVSALDPVMFYEL